MTARSTRFSPVFRSFLVLLSLGLVTIGCGPSNPDHTRPPGEQTSETAEQTSEKESARQQEEDTQSAESRSPSDTASIANKPTLVYYRMPG